MKDYAKIRQELNLLGIQIESFQENSRSFQGHGIYLKKNACHFKVAKTDTERLRLENSIYFLKQIQQNNPPFVTARILTTGYLQSGQFYKVESTVEGTPFAKLEHGIGILQVEKPKSFFQAIVRAILWIQQRKGLILPASFDEQLGTHYESIQIKAIRTMIRWIENSTPRALELLKIVESNKSAFNQATAHGDLTPINTIVNPENMSIGFVDMDLASDVAPKYYDLAEFFNRLWSRACDPSLAKLFLQEIMRSISEKEKKLFLQQFLTVLAYRAVGNFYEILHLAPTDDRKKRIRFATDFANYIADRKFIDDTTA